MRRHQYILIFGLLILVCLAIGIWSFGFWGNWDGKTKLSVISQSGGGDVKVEVFDPANQLITTINIPGSVEVNAANGLGTWKLGSITKLGIDKNLESGDFLKNTVIKSFNFPIDSANLSLIDRIRIKLFLLSVGNAGKANINLEDTGDLIKTQLTDGSKGYKISDTMPTRVEAYFNDANVNENVIVKNSTGSVSEGIMAGNVLSVLGAKIASIQNLESDNFGCKIMGTDEKLVTKIAKIFSCETNLLKPANNFDLEFDLGSQFKNRF